MGVDVYTPAFDRLATNPDYCAARAQLDRVCFAIGMNTETDETRAKFDRLSCFVGQFEAAAAHFRFRPPFVSKVPAVATWQQGCAYCFTLTHEDVGQLLVEYRTWLREAHQLFGARVLQIPANTIGVLNELQAQVLKFKALCRVFRLGEGCTIG